MSVISATVFRPAPLATSTSASASCWASSRRGHERARAGLDVEHERVEALGELLGQDRGDDQRDRLDRAGGVADGVQAAVGGREVGGLADDRAARLAHHAADHLGGGDGLVAGDRCRACPASRRCGRGRGRRSSAPPRRRRPGSGRGSARPCRPRRRSSACPAPAGPGPTRGRSPESRIAGVSAIRSSPSRPLRKNAIASAPTWASDSPPSVMPPTRKPISSGLSASPVALLADDLGGEHADSPPRISGRAARGRARPPRRCATSARARAPRRPCPRRGS